MFTLAMGMAVVAMVGPLDEPQVRISRPWGGPPEVIRQVVAASPVSSRGIEVPMSAVAGGGTVTVVGASELGAESIAAGVLGDEPMGLQTEQLLRAFGYDRDHFGYSYINYPRGFGGLGGGGGGGGFGGGGGHQDQPTLDAGLLGLLRNLAPIESRFPSVVGR